MQLPGSFYLALDIEDYIKYIIEKHEILPLNLLFIPTLTELTIARVENRRLI